MACVKKLRNVHLFRHRSANQIAVMQIHSTRFLDPFCNNKQEEMCNDRIVFSHLLFASSFVFISTYRHCSGKRFDWLQYASTEISPLYVRHALGHPLTDACSVNQVSGPSLVAQVCCGGNRLCDGGKLAKIYASL